MKKILVTAHRGAKGLVPYENTIEAFNKAIEVGADAIELDVRRSKDNIMFIHHDAAINNRLLAELNYKEIVELSLEKGFIPPTLEETVKLFKGRILIDIELKETGYEEEFVTLVLQYLNKNEFYIRTFNDSSVRYIKKKYPELTVGLLLGFEKPKYGFLTRLGELFPLRRVLKTKADFVSPNHRLVVASFVKRMHRLKRPVYVWTVNDEQLMKDLLAKNVDGLVSDYPDRVIKVINEIYNTN